VQAFYFDPLLPPRSGCAWFAMKGWLWHEAASGPERLGAGQVSLEALGISAGPSGRKSCDPSNRGANFSWGRSSGTRGPAHRDAKLNSLPCRSAQERDERRCSQGHLIRPTRRVEFWGGRLRFVVSHPSLEKSEGWGTRLTGLRFVGTRL
jgi:hypothetical protein